jgi:hypothetical protein
MRIVGDGRAVEGHAPDGGAGIDTDDSDPVTGVRVRIVREQGGGGNGQVGRRVGGQRVGARKGCVVAAVHGDRDRGRAGAAVAVGRGVAEGVDGRLSPREMRECGGRIIAQRAVQVRGDERAGSQRQRSDRRRRRSVDGAYRQSVVEIRIGVVG